MKVYTNIFAEILTACFGWMELILSKEIWQKYIQVVSEKNYTIFSF